MVFLQFFGLERLETTICNARKWVWTLETIKTGQKEILKYLQNSLSNDRKWIFLFFFNFLLTTWNLEGFWTTPMLLHTTWNRLNSSEILTKSFDIVQDLEEIFFVIEQKVDGTIFFVPLKKSQNKLIASQFYKIICGP